MPQHDAHHETVKRALVKDGWTVTHDPLVVRYKGLRLFIDIAAEKAVKTDQDEQRIAIEIKVFGGSSYINDFEKAVGQYSLYRDMLRRTQFDHELFLAVAQKSYEDFFLKAAVQEFTSAQQIHLLVFDPVREGIIKWIK